MSNASARNALITDNFISFAKYANGIPMEYGLQGKVVAMSEKQLNFEKWQYKAKDATPCPFCGSESVSVKHKEIRFYGWNGLGFKKHRMKAYCVCNKCGATGTPIYYDGYSNAPFAYYDDEHKRVYSCGEEAIKAWNTRKPMDKIVERLEELKQKEYDTEERCNEEGFYNDVEDAYEDGESQGLFSGFVQAIRIIKKEGGL